MTTPTEVRTVTLPPAVADAFAGLARDGVNLIITFIDATGRSVYSYRGSTHLQSGSRLAAWLRAKEGSLQSHVRDGSTVDVVYRNPRAQAYYLLTGFARLVDDPEEAADVYLGAPPHEQAADPHRSGCAMTIDITRVAGRDASGDLTPVEAA